jgi:hypothetical protein
LDFAEAWAASFQAASRLMDAHSLLREAYRAITEMMDAYTSPKAAGSVKGLVQRDMGRCHDPQHGGMLYRAITVERA